MLRTEFKAKKNTQVYKKGLVLKYLILMNETQLKLKQILDLASFEDKEKLRLEFSKMLPANKESKVTTKIGWGDYAEKTHSSISFFVSSSMPAKKEFDLLSLYSQILENINDSEKQLFAESLDVILSKKPQKVKLGNLPSLQIDNKFRAISTSFEIVAA